VSDHARAIEDDVSKLLSKTVFKALGDAETRLHLTQSF